MVPKILITAVLVGVLVVVAGFSGLLFRVWPTSWPDTELSVTSQQIERLIALQREPKFVADAKLFYPGVPKEEIRFELEKILNLEIEHIIKGVRQTPKKSFILSAFKQSLRRADRLDSEEKDRLVGYFNAVMQILGIQGSNELFNVWRYGFPYGWLKLDTQH